MNDPQRSLESIQDIRNMMERSSRFISLSGWSGISAGVCALVGAGFAYQYLHPVSKDFVMDTYEIMSVQTARNEVARFDSAAEGIISSALFWIGVITFVAAFASAFIFTYKKSKKQNIPIWGKASKRLMFSVMIPMIAGGIFMYRMIELGIFGLVAPACLVFYGLALLNASKYTLTEIRYLGIAQIILGLLNCWSIGYGLYFWAAGFGIMHIVYGLVMWWRYERN